MIVVVGQPAYRPPSDAAPGATAGAAVGPAVGVARAAVAAGAAVQLVAKVGSDEIGDALLLDLGRAGIGHAAVLRDAGHATPISRAPTDADPDADPSPDPSVRAAPRARPESVDGDPRLGPDQRLDPADVELGLRYLAGYGVIVAAEPLAQATLAIVAEAAAYAGAQLVVVTASGTAGPILDRNVPVTLLEAPPDDPDEQFAALVGRYAAALDAGVPADEAFRSALGASGWEPTAPTT